MVTVKSGMARILIGTRFFFISSYKGLEKKINTVKHNKYNPLDILFSTFIYVKNNKNALPYNGIYKSIQGYRQAQNQHWYTCINIVNKPLDGLILASIEQNKQASYAQVFPQVIQKKSLKFNSSGIKPDREIHTDSYIAILN